MKNAHFQNSKTCSPATCINCMNNHGCMHMQHAFDVPVFSVDAKNSSDRIPHFNIASKGETIHLYQQSRPTG